MKYATQFILSSDFFKLCDHTAENPSSEWKEAPKTYVGHVCSCFREHAKTSAKLLVKSVQYYVITSNAKSPFYALQLSIKSF